ncbi:MAG: hypothetical protein ACPGLY_22650, partial [Rubripirellula sp.]
TLARPRENRRIFVSALCFEWLGQTVASLCWIGSVISYGISSSGDWLQLVAASAWLLANIAAISTFKADENIDRNANA